MVVPFGGMLSKLAEKRAVLRPLRLCRMGGDGVADTTSMMAPLRSISAISTLEADELLIIPLM